jgi:hypothetical protein
MSQASHRVRAGPAGNNLQIVVRKLSSASVSVMLSRIAPLASAGQTVLRAFVAKRGALGTTISNAQGVHLTQSVSDSVR